MPGPPPHVYGPRFQQDNPNPQNSQAKRFSSEPEALKKCVVIFQKFRKKSFKNLPQDADITSHTLFHIHGMLGRLEEGQACVVVLSPILKNRTEPTFGNLVCL